MYLQSYSCTRFPSSRKNGMRSSRSMSANPGTSRPRRWTGAFEEMIAPMPPRANRTSQLIRTEVPEPSVVVEAPREAGAQDPVFQRQAPQTERLEDDVGAHRSSDGSGAPSYTDMM